MHLTYVQSAEPYGHLENLLRRAIVAHGAGVTEQRSLASAVLAIIETNLKRRVVAVNSQGQPLQYNLHYEVRFGLRDAAGNVLLKPQGIDLLRNFAYNVHIELGASRRRSQLVRDMQSEAARLIMLRLEALPAGDRASPGSG
ncbi:MAG: LPS assembly lipoprotein LptE [Gammaproteobacteria bacterium]|nr:LPS assembly lipoprotein LptE [Gammaproteobacteria bacterium]